MTWYQILNTVYVVGVIILFSYQWLDIEFLGGDPGIAWKDIFLTSLRWPCSAVWFLLIPFSEKIREDFNTLRMEKRVYKLLRLEELKRKEEKLEEKPQAEGKS